MSFLQTFKKHTPEKRSVKTTLRELAQRMAPAAIGKRFQAEGREVGYDLQHLALLIEENGVKAEAHEKGVNR